jgi:choline kinase
MLVPILLDDTPPHALLLAAGVGKRLGQDDPKILLDVGGTTLLARHLLLLQRSGVQAATVVIGHRADRMRAAITAATPEGLAVTTIENPAHREGSVVSLDAAHAVLSAGGPVLLMDGDVLYDRRMLERLLSTTHENAFLVDRRIEPGDEPVKLCIAGNRIVDFRKKPELAHDWHGESVGFFKFSGDIARELAERARAYVEGGRRGEEYEEAIRDMLLADAERGVARFGWVDVTDLPWTEIDFPEDAARARAEILPELVA